MVERLFDPDPHANPEIALERALVGGHRADRDDDLVDQPRQQWAHHGGHRRRELVPRLISHDSSQGYKFQHADSARV
jgi:hypothetical protein